jgi:hypothetical protein
MLVEPDARAGLGHDRCERGLADLKRIAPEVIAVQFDQVKGVGEHALVSALVMDEIEQGNAIVIAGNSLAINDAGGRAEAGQRLDD